MNIRKIVRTTSIIIISVIAVLWSLMPFVWMGVISLTVSGYIPTEWRLPEVLTIDTWLAVLSPTLPGTYPSLGGMRSPTYIIPAVQDTTIIALIAVAVCLAVSLWAGYAFSRFKFRASDVFYDGLLIIRMIPMISLAIPFFVLYRTYGLMDTHLGVGLLHATINLPLAIWIMKGFFDTLPREIEEAAFIDGASFPQVFFRIAIPLVSPGIAVAACLVFLFSYIEYMGALILSRGHINTIPLFIAGILMGEHRQWWNELGAVSIISTIPLAIFFIIVGKYLVRGLTMGAIKG